MRQALSSLLHDATRSLPSGRGENGGSAQTKRPQEGGEERRVPLLGLETPQPDLAVVDGRLICEKESASATLLLKERPRCGRRHTATTAAEERVRCEGRATCHGTFCYLEGDALRAEIGSLHFARTEVAMLARSAEVSFYSHCAVRVGLG